MKRGVAGIAGLAAVAGIAVGALPHDRPAPVTVPYDNAAYDALVEGCDPPHGHRHDRKLTQFLSQLADTLRAKNPRAAMVIDGMKHDPCHDGDY